MKHFKNIISICIIATLLFSLFSFNVFAADTYTVVGDESLCGSSWDKNNQDNVMKFDDLFGYYKKDFFDVPKGRYEIKVVKNGTEYFGNENGGNYIFEVQEACTVTVLFDDTTNTIRLLGVHIKVITPIPFQYESVCVYGNGNGQWLNGAIWDANNSSNFMTEIEKGLFEITYQNVESGNYSFKFAVDGDENKSFGLGKNLEIGTFCDSSYNGDNINFEATEDSNIKIILDIRGFDNSTKEGAMLKIEYFTNSSVTSPTPTSKPTSTPTSKPTSTPVPSSTVSADIEHSTTPTDVVATNSPTSTQESDPTTGPIQSTPPVKTDDGSNIENTTNSSEVTNTPEKLNIEPQNNNSDNNTLIIIISVIAGVAIIAGAIFIWLYLKKRK